MLRRQAQLGSLLKLWGDLLATALALTGAYLLYFQSGAFTISKGWYASRYSEALLPALLLCVLGYTLTGSYRLPAGSRSGPATLRPVLGAVLAATLFLAAGVLVIRDEYQFSRGMLALFPVLAVPLVLLFRRASRGLLAMIYRRGIGASRAIIVGSAPAAAELARLFESQPGMGVRLAARLSEDADLGEALGAHRPEQVFLAFSGEKKPELDAAIRRLAHEMVDVRVVPDLARPFEVNPEVLTLGGLPVVTIQQTTFYGLNRFLKRAFDLVAGAILFAMVLPVGAVVAIVLLLTSGRPLFYSQERMGLDGRRFRILKFRTMRVGAESETGAVWSKAGDPRCTRVGAVLRRFSLDELPQIGNVLVGDMSLVGPRPERPVFIEEFRRRLPGYMLRHRIPAGLTGLAQVRGFRGDTDLAERLRCDLEYLERWSLFFDVEILIRTFWRVLLGK